MSGPWYESQGPNAEQVRKDVLSNINKFQVGKDTYQKEKNDIIQKAIMKIIPDTRNDFGSYRGYATFNLKTELANEVIKEVRKNYALLIIKKKFTRFVTHHLYKPDGIRMKKIVETTKVGKNSAIV
jgi:hypothetical protein